MWNDQIESVTGLPAVATLLLTRRGRGTARSGVEGAAVAQRLDVRLDHPKRGVQILENQARREAQRPHAAQRQPGITFRITRLSVAKPMGLAIDLDAEFDGVAIEIQHIGADGVLAAEFQSLCFASQGDPETGLGRRHPATKRPGATDGWLGCVHAIRMSNVRDPASPLHPASRGPPPPTGEEKDVHASDSLPFIRSVRSDAA